MSTTEKAATGGEKFDGFTDEERAAMREHAQDLKKTSRRSPAKGKAKADGERDVLEKIAELQDADRVLAERLHEIIKKAAPQLTPKTWYGMPAYAKDGKVLCFFQSAAKFKARYATFGFNDGAALDDGDLWPTGFALTTITPAVEARIIELLERAAS